MAYNMGTSNASQEELERLKRQQEAIQNANNAQQVSTPTSYSGYTPGQTVQNYQQQANNLQAQKPVNYTSKYQDGIDQLFDKILNRGKFEYDMNADTLYKQAMDKYAQQAKMSMQDTMGQAQAMTGGYSNSYAQTVGQQTYDKTMQNVTDMLPAMEELSRSKWNDEGNQMAQNLALSQNAEQQEYGKYRDAYGDWQYDYGTALDRYNNERGFDYSQFSDTRNYDFQQEQFNYQKQQDAQARADAQAAQAAAAAAAAARSSGGGGRSGGEGSGLKPTDKHYAEGIRLLNLNGDGAVYGYCEQLEANGMSEADAEALASRIIGAKKKEPTRQDAWERMLGDYKF